MADKLMWLNKHLILIRYLTVEETMAEEGYKIRPDLEEDFAGVRGAEKMVFKLAGRGNYKDACELLSYIAHRRAAIWWGYRCVLSLLEELREKPAKDRDIADIGTNFATTVPDWAKVELPKQSPLIQGLFDHIQAENERNFKDLEAQLDPEYHAFVKEAVEVVFQEFKKVHGIHPIDLLKKAGTRINEDPYPIAPDSPAFSEAAKLKSQLGALQKETVETIKSVLPPKVPEYEKKVRDNALAAVYRWIVAPDEMNSNACLGLGNACPDTPSGLLCLSAFWAFGNLLPGGDQIVPTPPGLAANGLSQVLLMCALHKGGVRKLKARYELYFNLGVDVLSGKDNWGESLAEGTAPHESLSGGGASGASGPPPSEAPRYKRWKPGDPGK
ncbi:MAG: hypothetical protein LBC51_03735 [Treponema sp.]|jgi:hypothetical protein|nr:hypothetical protein [Treponema sp.]